MYRLVIADDDEIIRRGLEEFVDWSGMGFELEVTFEDGDELITYIQNHSVDVVLTDIRMINVSGLEVAKFVYENLPSTKVVIISAYKEFEYAKKAIEYNVKHYLVKPTEYDEITRVFSDIRVILDKEHEIERAKIEFSTRYSELIPIMQEQFFVDLLIGALREENEIKKRMELLNLNFDPSVDQCFIIDVSYESYNKYLNEHWQYGREALNVKLKNLIYGIEGKNRVQYYTLFNTGYKPRVIAIAAIRNGIDTTSFIIDNHLQSIMKSIKNVLNYKIELKIERGFNNIFELVSQKISFSIDKDKQLEGGKTTLILKDYERLIDIYKLFVSNIIDGDCTAIMSLIDSFIDKIQALPICYIHQLIVDLFSILANRFMDFNTEFWRIITGKIDFNHIFKIMNIDEIRSWLKNIFKDIVNSFDSYKNLSSDYLIYNAKRFIDQNYHKDIMLSDVADQVFLNPVYFSRVFKQQTGENFTDYLTKVRMEKAIDLLKQKCYKIYEISGKVGYKNSRYFSRVFKRYTGYTTTEYVRLTMKNDGESI